MKKPFIIGLAVFFAILGVGYYLFIASLAGPKVQGKTVVKWTEDLASRDESIRKAAKEVMKQRASEFLPALLTLMTMEDSAEKQKWATVFHVEYTPSYAGRLSASRAFAVIGSAAAPVIPQLIPLLNNTNSSIDAANALAAIGKESVQPLINRMGTGDSFGKGMAAAAISKIKPEDAAPAIDPLIKLTKDSDVNAQEWAAKALGNIALKPEICLPVLIGLLDSKSVPVVNAAISGLGNYGTAAKEALPKIEPFTKSRVDDLKSAAMNAVAKINGTDGKPEEPATKKSE